MYGCLFIHEYKLIKEAGVLQQPAFTKQVVRGTMQDKEAT